MGRVRWLAATGARSWSGLLPGVMPKKLGHDVTPEALERTATAVVAFVAGLTSSSLDRLVLHS